jgi:hypothetical protein
MTSDRKEHTVKSTLEVRLVRLTLLGMAFAGIASTGGFIKVYSDETLKRDVEPVRDATEKLAQLTSGS